MLCSLDLKVKSSDNLDTYITKICYTLGSPQGLLKEAQDISKKRISDKLLLGSKYSITTAAERIHFNITRKAIARACRISEPALRRAVRKIKE